MLDFREHQQDPSFLVDFLDHDPRFSIHVAAGRRIIGEMDIARDGADLDKNGVLKLDCLIERPVESKHARAQGGRDDQDRQADEKAATQ